MDEIRTQQAMKIQNMCTNKIDDKMKIEVEDDGSETLSPSMIYYWILKKCVCVYVCAVHCSVQCVKKIIKLKI